MDSRLHPEVHSTEALASADERQNWNRLTRRSQFWKNCIRRRQQLSRKPPAVQRWCNGLKPNGAGGMKIRRGVPGKSPGAATRWEMLRHSRAQLSVCPISAPVVTAATIFPPPVRLPSPRYLWAEWRSYGNNNYLQWRFVCCGDKCVVLI